MHRPARWLVALSVLVSAMAGAGTAAGQPAPFGALVVGIVDGDTLDVLAGGARTRIRLDGIDCPELGQPYGKVARLFASERASGKRVEIVPSSIDRNGRVIARVRAGNEDLGLALLRAGLAWHYTLYSNDPAYAAAERAARAARVGLWADREPTPPWVQRRHAAAPAPAQPAAPATKPKADTVAGPFHGNVKSLVFHAPGCPNYTCRQCTAVFATAAEALAKGFKPAGDCLK